MTLKFEIECHLGLQACHMFIECLYLGNNPVRIHMDKCLGASGWVQRQSCLSLFLHNALAPNKSIYRHMNPDLANCCLQHIKAGKV